MQNNFLIFTSSEIHLFMGDKKHIDKWNYNTATLEGLLIQIHKKYRINEIGILLNNEVSYTVSLDINSKLKSDELKSAISSKLSEKIPELSSNLVWDYKLLTKTGGDNVQVAGVSRSFIEKIFNYADGNKIKIKFIEPICYSFSKILNIKDKKYIVIFTADFERIILVINKGIIIYIINIQETNIPESIDNVFNYIRSKYPNESEIEILYEDNLHLLKDNDLKKFTDSGYKINTMDLVKSIFTYPSDLKNKKDSESLVISRPKISDVIDDDIEISEEDRNNKLKSRKNKKQILYGVVLLFTFTILIGVLFKYLNNNSMLPFNKKDIPSNIYMKPSVVVQTIPSLTPTPTPEIVFSNFKGYKLEILNGSGIKGEADKVKFLADKLEFDEIITGNADNYNYTETIISFKDDSLYKGIQLLEDSLSDYKLLFSETSLPEDSEYDIRIIVGKEKSDNIDE